MLVSKSAFSLLAIVAMAQGSTTVQEGKEALAGMAIAPSRTEPRTQPLQANRKLNEDGSPSYFEDDDAPAYVDDFAGSSPSPLASFTPTQTPVPVLSTPSGSPFPAPSSVAGLLPSASPPPSQWRNENTTTVSKNVAVLVVPLPRLGNPTPDSQVSGGTLSRRGLSHSGYAHGRKRFLSDQELSQWCSILTQPSAKAALFNAAGLSASRVLEEQLASSGVVGATALATVADALAMDATTRALRPATCDGNDPIVDTDVLSLTIRAFLEVPSADSGLEQEALSSWQVVAGIVDGTAEELSNKAAEYGIDPFSGNSTQNLPDDDEGSGEVAGLFEIATLLSADGIASFAGALSSASLDSTDEAAAQVQLFSPDGAALAAPARIYRLPVAPTPSSSPSNPGEGRSTQAYVWILVAIGCAILIGGALVVVRRGQLRRAQNMRMQAPRMPTTKGYELATTAPKVAPGRNGPSVVSSPLRSVPIGPRATAENWGSDGAARRQSRPMRVQHAARV